MANISNTVNTSFRVDRNLKRKADELFKSLGLNTSVALNMFLTQCIREQGIPFTPSRNTGVIEEKGEKEYKSIMDIE